MYSFHPIKREIKSKPEDNSEITLNLATDKKDDKSVDHEQESFPNIRERSNTLDSKVSGSIFQQKKGRDVISKKHQAYSLLYSNNLADSIKLK